MPLRYLSIQRPYDVLRSAHRDAHDFFELPIGDNSGKGECCRDKDPALEAHQYLIISFHEPTLRSWL